MAKILAFAGSTRSGSFNKMMVKVAADGARSAGAEVNFIDLRDFPMPIYDGDLEKESGVPEHARRLRELMGEHQGLLIASPENNSTISSVLKNTIDWISRPDGDTPGLVAFKGKVAGIMAASPGKLGGIRGLQHVRNILGSGQVRLREVDAKFRCK